MISRTFRTATPNSSLPIMKVRYLPARSSDLSARAVAGGAVRVDCMFLLVLGRATPLMAWRRVRCILCCVCAATSDAATVPAKIGMKSPQLPRTTVHRRATSSYRTQDTVLLENFANFCLPQYLRGPQMVHYSSALTPQAAGAHRSGIIGCGERSRVTEQASAGTS